MKKHTMITASITEIKAKLSEYIKLCDEANQIVVITKRGKPVAAITALPSLDTLIDVSERSGGLNGVDEAFARQLAEFIEQYRPALETLSRK